jgi:ribosomal protein S6--L-glutamate ligase
VKLYFLLAYSRKTMPIRPLLADVVSILEARGIEVVTGIAESIVLRPEALRVEADLYILKSHSVLWLNLAAVLDAQHARILNPYSSCVSTVNKIRATHRLAASHVPIPRSWVTGDLQHISKVTDVMPLLVKPNIGRGGIGIKIAHNHDELAALHVEDGMFVQEHVASVDDEQKVYVVGDRAFSVRKIRDTGERQPCELDSEIEAIAFRCGRALGLGVYGVDIILSANGAVVVDVNYFPSFRGVPGASEILADYITHYARGDLPMLSLPS